MLTPIITTVFDRRKRASAKKEGSIEIRITYGRKQRYITTGIRCLPKQWRSGCIVNRLDAFELQNELDRVLTNVRKNVNAILEGGEFDIITINKKVSKKQQQDNEKNATSNRLLIDFMRERAEIRKFGKKQDTQERYDRFLDFFEKWGGMVTFEDLTPQKIIELDKALPNMKEASRWHNYHRFLNSFIKDAMDEGLVRKNPYKSGLNIKKVECEGGLEKYLTKEEFDAIANLNIEENYIRHARDLFLFQTYTCMAFVDLADFNTNLIKMVNDSPMYSGRRGKTGIGYQFMLVPQAMEILQRYDMKLPIMCNQDYNKCLKTIAAMAGIKKHVTTHWARHTGATLLLNAGVDMEVVARILGHSSTKMTREVYAKMLDTTIADAMSKVKF